MVKPEECHQEDERPNLRCRGKQGRRRKEKEKSQSYLISEFWFKIDGRGDQSNADYENLVTK